MKKIQGKDLIFISQINRDGSGTSKIKGDYLKLMQEEYFKIISLSITEGTFIASEMNCFVVKLKKSKL